MRKGARSQHHLGGLAGTTVMAHHLDTIFKRPERRDIEAFDAPAYGAEMFGQRQRVELRVGDGIPSRRERAAGETRRDAGLYLGHLFGIEMPELDTVALTRLPAGKRTFELRIAFIDLEVALFAQ